MGSQTSKEEQECRETQTEKITMGLLELINNTIHDMNTLSERINDRQSLECLDRLIQSLRNEKISLSTMDQKE